MGMIQTLSSIVFNGGGIILILLILIRKGESGGLSSAFGGAGGADLLGVRAQKQLDKLITYIAAFFIGSAILLNTPAVRHHGKQMIDNNEVKESTQQGTEEKTNNESSKEK
ncbi:preprotein translocase subunit SecG [Candidatus Uabimicrobium sp. HlEnr_7]|uniref:preprotein translocase subunit SecG n=1 Tax=Candidatus Uabimicrobium helgolandensis TaxID=3095367 RepID=UPI0035576D49